MKTGGGATRSLLALVSGGLGVGALVKLADESPLANQLGLNDLGTYLGLWVVVVVVLAAWSPSRWLAALRVSAFLLAMVAAYYGVTQLLFGFVPLLLWLAWTTAALTAAPLLASIVWHAQARPATWLGAFGVALHNGAKRLLAVVASRRAASSPGYRMATLPMRSPVTLGSG